MKLIKCERCGKTIRVQYDSIDECFKRSGTVKCVPSCGMSENLCKQCYLTLKKDSDCSYISCIKSVKGKCQFKVMK